jgi:hypothetical protein
MRNIWLSWLGNLRQTSNTYTHLLTIFTDVDRRGWAWSATAAITYRSTAVVRLPSFRGSRSRDNDHPRSCVSVIRRERNIHIGPTTCAELVHVLRLCNALRRPEHETQIIVPCQTHASVVLRSSSVPRRHVRVAGFDCSRYLLMTWRVTSGVTYRSLCSMASLEFGKCHLS